MVSGWKEVGLEVHLWGLACLGRQWVGVGLIVRAWIGLQGC